MRPPTGTAAPLAARSVCCDGVIHRSSVNTKIMHLKKTLESLRSPSVSQLLTIIQADILHHAEHFLNATYCSYYVTVVTHAQPPWHLSRRVTQKGRSW